MAGIASEYEFVVIKFDVLVHEANHFYCFTYVWDTQYINLCAWANVTKRIFGIQSLRIWFCIVFCIEINKSAIKKHSTMCPISGSDNVICLPLPTTHMNFVRYLGVWTSSISYAGRRFSFYFFILCKWNSRELERHLSMAHRTEQMHWSKWSHK